MTEAASALLPIVALLFAGLGLQRTRFVAPEFWAGAERLTYYILFPALLIRSLATQTLAGLPWIALLTAVYGAILLTAAGLLGLRGWIGRGDGPAFTSVFQGGIRFNTYIGLALAAALLGGEGLAVGAVVAGCMIILINVLCVTVLTLARPGSQGLAKRAAVSLATNPLIAGCLIGGGLNLGGITLPQPVLQTLAIAGGAALPLGLLCVGASLQVQRLSSHLRGTALSAVAKVIVMPALGAALCWALGLPQPLASLIVLFLALPTAPSSYILARQLGGDHHLMASIVTAQTMLAFLTLPLMLHLLRLP